MKLIDKVQIGTLTLKNRLVMPPMATRKSEAGRVTDELVNYYKERAGKIGLIIMEYSYVSPEGQTGKGQVSIACDEDIQGLKKITDAVHAQGTTAIFAQINHGGIAAGYEVKDQEDIHRIIHAFADAALRAKAAGFDGVEIHAAHGYLLNQFYSPLTNHRNDVYSGLTLEGRTRLTKEVIAEVRKAVGEDYPVSVRFGACDYQVGACDYQEGGSTVDDIPTAAKIYEEAGADMISITGGMNGYIIKGNTAPGWFSELSAAAKHAVSIPVLLTGGIRTRSQADRFLQDGAADLIGIGRPFLQNPQEKIDELLSDENAAL